MESHYHNPGFKQVWPGGGCIEVVAKHGGYRGGEVRPLASFPMEFLRQGGVLNWQYILEMTQMTVQEIGRLSRGPRSIYQSAVSMNLTPSTGTCHFLRADGATKSFTMVNGPRFEYATALEKDGGGGRVTTDEDLKPHSILPNRKEWFAAAWNRPLSSITAQDLEKVSNCFLLGEDLAREWRNGKWAFYVDPQDGDQLIIHAFDNGVCKASHGQKRRLSSLKNGSQGDKELVDVELLKWHYKQCILKHVRGFSFFPTKDYYFEHHRECGGEESPCVVQ